MVSGLWKVASFRGPDGCLSHNPDWGWEFRAARSVPRLGGDSADVRILQGGLRDCQDWAGLLGRNGEDVRIGRTCVRLEGAGPRTGGAGG